MLWKNASALKKFLLHLGIENTFPRSGIVVVVVEVCGWLTVSFNIMVGMKA